MRIGFLLGADGTVKHIWTQISGECAMPVEPGDEIIETAIDHGERVADPAAKQAAVDRCSDIQQSLRAYRTRDAVLNFIRSLGNEYGHRTIATIHPGAMRAATPPSQPQEETMYRSDGALVVRHIGSPEFPARRATQHHIIDK